MKRDYRENAIKGDKQCGREFGVDRSRKIGVPGVISMMVKIVKVGFWRASIDIVGNNLEFRRTSM
jgi:hypothetical protein